MKQALSSVTDTIIAKGAIALSAGRYSDALVHFKLACVQPHGEAKGYKGLGICLQHLEQYEDAENAYRRALNHSPQDPELWANLGTVLHTRGQLSEAQQCLQEAATLQPDDPDIQYNLGNFYTDANQPRAATRAFRRTLELAPSHYDALINWGIQSKAHEDFEAAERCYRRALMIDSGRAEAYTNLAALLSEQGDFETAEGLIEQGFRRCGDDPDLYYNLGNINKTKRAYEDALKAFRVAIQLRPQMAEAHWNKALTHLALGQYRRGWREYEWRLRKADWSHYYPYEHDTSLWQGEDISEQTLLVHDEQGYGDTIQFCRYLPAVRRCCKKLIFETRRPLMDLFVGSSHIDCLVERPVSAHKAVRWDCHIPLLSIPYLFNTDIDTIPGATPYLTAPMDRIQRFRGAMDLNKTNVGLVWAGNPNHHNDANRSLHLNDLRYLFDDSGVAWHSIQKGPAAKQALHHPFDSLLQNWEEKLLSFADTAALIWALDYVISVDTAVAHLAGALGKPFKLILPNDGKDWRWAHPAARRNWYPSLIEIVRPTERTRLCDLTVR